MGIYATAPPEHYKTRKHSLTYSYYAYQLLKCRNICTSVQKKSLKIGDVFFQVRFCLHCSFMCKDKHSFFWRLTHTDTELRMLWGRKPQATLTAGWCCSCRSREMGALVRKQCFFCSLFCLGLRTSCYIIVSWIPIWLPNSLYHILLVCKILQAFTVPTRAHTYIFELYLGWMRISNLNVYQKCMRSY